MASGESPSDFTPTFRPGGRIRAAAGIVALVAVLAFLVSAARILLWSIQNEAFWAELVQKQVPTLIGLPLAAIGSLCVVLLLESTSGPIELEAIGVKFKGASGPVILWLLCFLAMAWAIKTTWR